jgi:type II secretory ATPase GspE/PulE/Tfp pilus assembly ATPase PilB-like protein
MRLLDPNSLKTLDDLFQDSPMLLKRMKSLVGIRNKIGGVVLLSGPTGSGKSTTLYAIIRQLDRYR